MVTGKLRGDLWMAEVIPTLLKTGRTFPTRRWTNGIGLNGGGFFSDSGSGRGGGVQELNVVAILGGLMISCSGNWVIELVTLWSGLKEVG